MDKKQKGKQSAAALAGVFFLIFLDQYTKILAVRHLKEQEPFVILKGVFELHYLENRGMAFGLMQNQRIFFVLATTVVFFLLVYFYLKTPAAKKYLPIRICTVFLTAGAGGNFIDRLLKGYVVDFFYFSLIDFPIFNVADIFVTMTFVVLLLLIFFYYKDDDFLVYIKRDKKRRKDL